MGLNTWNEWEKYVTLSSLSIISDLYVTPLSYLFFFPRAEQHFFPLSSSTSRGLFPKQNLHIEQQRQSTLLQMSQSHKKTMHINQMIIKTKPENANGRCSLLNQLFEPDSQMQMPDSISEVLKLGRLIIQSEQAFASGFDCDFFFLLHFLLLCFLPEVALLISDTRKKSN